MDWLHKWAQTTQSLALRCLDTGKSFTYPELDVATNRLASYLQQKLQVKEGDRVCMLATNQWEHIVCFFACQRLGAIFVPLNFRLAERELIDVIYDAMPKVLFLEETFADVGQRLARGAALSAVSYPLSVISQLLADNREPLTVNLHPGANSYLPTVNGLQTTAPCLMLYTSGTTGRPKGVLLSEEGMFWNALNTALRLGLNFETKHLCFHPFFHASGWNVLTLPTLRFGGTVYLQSKFEPTEILNLISKLKINILFGVPTMLDRMAHTDVFAQTDLSSLRFAIVGGEPMPLEAIKMWHARNIPIRQGFGLTEFGPNVFSLNAQDAERKLGSIGTPNFYLQVRVVNDKGQLCSADEIGELQLKGPVCMLGYWNKIDETQKAFDGEWLKTGDLVSFDSDGYFFVRGRKKEMYISGGENVFPAEVERVLRSLPNVREAAVVGVPDEKWGEVGCAFVVLQQQGLTSCDDLISQAKNCLAKYKVPKHVRLVDELPKSDSGKILKRSLTAAFVPG